MAGLRERKKEATCQKILDAASKLFREVGYEAARIEDIADAADLSPATVYNYFGAKADILLKFVTVETERVLADGELCIQAPQSNPTDTFNTLVNSYFGNSFVLTSREMWRVAVSHTIRSPRAEFSQRYIELDQCFVDQMCRFIELMQANGLVSSTINSVAIGEILFNNINMNFILSMRGDHPTSADAVDAVKRQSAPLLKLIST